MLKVEQFFWLVLVVSKAKLTKISVRPPVKNLLSSQAVRLSVGLFAFVVILGGTMSAIRLASINQETRKQAQEADDNLCEWCGSTCKLKNTMQACQEGDPLRGYDCQYISTDEHRGCFAIPEDPQDPNNCEWCGRECVKTGSVNNCLAVLPPIDERCEWIPERLDCDEVPIVAQPTATPIPSISPTLTTTPRPTSTVTPLPTATPQPGSPTPTPRPTLVPGVTVSPAPTSATCEPQCQSYPACYYAIPSCEIDGLPRPVGGWCKPADFDKDHDVDSADVSYLVDRFFSTSSSTSVQLADLNRDGSVDLRDYHELVKQWTGSRNVDICENTIH
ncbi:MAG: dockerin type I domain-containing protein [Patescibacteria group bacterium]